MFTSYPCFYISYIHTYCYKHLLLFTHTIPSIIRYIRIVLNDVGLHVVIHIIPVVIRYIHMVTTIKCLVILIIPCLYNTQGYQYLISGYSHQLYKLTYFHTFIHEYMHTYIHIHIHTYLQTHTHKHT